MTEQTVAVAASPLRQIWFQLGWRIVLSIAMLALAMRLA